MIPPTAAKYGREAAAHLQPGAHGVRVEVLQLDGLDRAHVRAAVRVHERKATAHKVPAADQGSEVCVRVHGLHTATVVTVMALPDGLPIVVGSLMRLLKEDIQPIFSPAALSASTPIGSPHSSMNSQARCPEKKINFYRRAGHKAAAQENRIQCCMCSWW